MTRFVSVVSLLFMATAAHAAERSYTVTGFDGIRVEGPFAVTVTSARGPSARATGTVSALDDLVIRVDGRTLVVRRGGNGWGGYPGAERGPVAVVITGATLTSASLSGAGMLDIDTMRGQRLNLILDGAGRLRVGRVATDRLALTLAGAGTLTVGGQVAETRVVLRGAGTLDGAALTAADADVSADGSGAVRLAVRRAAKVQATGSSSVAIAGKPACTVRNSGAGEVTCGAPHD